MRKFCLLLLWIFSTSITSLFAQTKEKSGKITDANGTGVSYASVKVKGSSRGAKASADGSFKIMVNDNDSIIVSAVGYETRTLLASDANLGSIQLQQDIRALNEVVVTGVGVATDKRKIAIDVSSLNSKDIPKSAVASIEQALVGKISGAQIQFNSGTPGTGATIQLRGVTDVGNTPPMILLDGIEVSDLNGLDVASVERVEVVKGAAAGMLYGAQGAAGVIQVFTKKGSRSKKPSVSLNTQLSFDQIIKGNRPLIAKYHSFETDADGYILSGGSKITKSPTGQWSEPDLLDPAVDPNVVNNKPYKEQTYDHIEQAYKKAFTNNLSLNINGGGEKSDYSFTLSRFIQNNVLDNQYQRVNLGSNLGFELFKGFTVRNITQVIHTQDNLLSGDADIQLAATNSNRFSITNSWPFIDFKFKDSTGHYVVNNRAGDQSLNPLSERDWHQRETNSYRVLNNINLNYKFPRFVELDYKYGIEVFNTDYTNTYFNQSSALQYSIAKWGTAPLGSINKSYARFTNQNSLATASVKLDFQNDFKMDIPLRSTTIVGYDWRKREYTAYFTQSSNLAPYPPINLNSGLIKSNGDGLFAGDPLGNFAFATYGVLVSQSFDYGNLFGISGGFRSDYSSEFGEATKPFTFPRGAVYFRPSELLKMHNLLDWKIRGAYGEAGIQPNYYARQVTLGTFPLGSGGLGLLLNSQVSNPALRVQRSKELEIGTDITFKSNLDSWLTRITLSATYWNRKSTDIIQDAPLPLTSGAGTLTDNLISITSKGFDISLDANVYEGSSIKWNTGVRFGRARSIADQIALHKDIVNGFFAVKEGQELGILYAPTPLHSINQMRPDGKTPYIDPSQAANYEVVNGIVVDKASKKALITDPTDQSVLGSVYPKFNMSFINSVVIKNNLTISAQLDWYYGNKIYNIVRQWLYRDRLSRDYDDAITVDGKPGAYVNFYNSLYNSVQPISWFVEDGSFIRLRDLSVSYNFTDAVKVKWVKNLTLSLSARNLFTITNYKGLDPEATGSEDSQGNAQTSVAAFKGADYFHVPNLKSFIVGLNIGF